MLVWLDSFEVLAPLVPQSSATLTDCTATTADPLTARRMPGFPAEEGTAAPAPKRRRRSAPAQATTDRPGAGAPDETPA